MPANIHGEGVVFICGLSQLTRSSSQHAGNERGRAGTRRGIPAWPTVGESPFIMLRELHEGKGQCPGDFKAADPELLREHDELRRQASASSDSRQRTPRSVADAPGWRPRWICEAKRCCCEMGDPGAAPSLGPPARVAGVGPALQALAGYAVLRPLSYHLRQVRSMVTAKVRPSTLEAKLVSLTHP